MLVWAVALEDAPLMGTHCPKDMTPCPDDACRGTNSCLETGEALLERCPRCGQLFDEHSSCACADPEGSGGADLEDDEDLGGDADLTDGAGQHDDDDEDDFDDLEDD